MSYLRRIQVGTDGEIYDLRDARINAIDSAPTENSTNVATSGGTKTALNAKANQTDLDKTNTTVEIEKKKLSNVIELLKGTEYTLTDGTTPSYTQLVPTGSMPYAALRMLGGKTQPWNQLAYAQTTGLNGSTVSGVTFTTESGYTKINGTATAYITNCYFDRSHFSASTTSGHKYLLWGCAQNNGSYYLEPLVGAGGDFCYGQPHEHGGGVIFESKKTDGTPTFIYGIRFEISAGSTFSNTKINCYVADLTLLGMSDITSLADPRIAQIKAYASLHPEYNAGSLVSAQVNNVKSVGANVWDEEWELGEFNTSTGATYPSSERIRSKNYVPVLPSTTYYLKCGNLSSVVQTCWYDASKTFIGSSPNFTGGGSITSPSNAYYVKFSPPTTYGTTYNHDIQICLNTYSAKTTYHPYTASSLPIPTAVQNLDGYGQSAGTVYNYVDLEPVKYSNMKSVDLGTLTWTYWSADGEWYTDGLSGIAVEPVSASIPLNAICTTYPISSYSGKYTGAMYLLSGRLYCKNYSSTTSPTGILHYEATSGGSDYNAKLYHKRVGSVDLGSLTWNYHSATQSFYTIISDGEKYGASGYTNGKSVCSKYSSSRTDPMTDKTVAVGTYFGDSSNAWCVIKDTSYSDAAAFKTAMSGVYLFYELASEQILDVTDLVNDDNFIEVENSGTVTFHQQNDVIWEVPNTTTYMTKISEAI